MENKYEEKPYVEVVKEIKATRNDNLEYVEKRQYAIATGALALSITLLTVTIEKGIPCDMWNRGIICFSWFALVVSILSNFQSNRAGSKAAEKALTRIYPLMRSETIFNDERINTIITEENKSTETWNNCAFWSLLLGVCAMMVFFVRLIWCFY